MNIYSRALAIKSRNNQTIDFQCASVLNIIQCLDKNLLVEAATCDNLLFTSMNSVDALVANLQHFKDSKLTQEVKSKRCFVVGLKSQKLLEENGFKNIYITSSNIENLKPAFKNHKIFYLSGYDTSFSDYEKYGIVRSIIYRAIPKRLDLDVQNRVLEGEFSHILFYSSKSAESFFNNFSEDFRFNNVQFVCISKKVAEVVESIINDSNVIYPDIESEEAMLTTIKQNNYNS